MPTHKHTRSRSANARRTRRVTKTRASSPSVRTPALIIGSFCVVASFLFGIESAGDVHTVGALQAAAPVVELIAGDMDGDGSLTAQDALIVAEAIRSGDASENHLAADPSGDAHLTLDDLLFILRHAAR